MSTTTQPTVADAVAALKQFQKDIDAHNNASSGTWWFVGKPAPPELIAHFRANPQLLPPELVDLYELMNGCGLSWGFMTEPAPGLNDEEA